MNTSYSNPFAHYAAITHGDAFVGRHTEITEIVNRVVIPEQPGCVSIVGPPRIGKSSLAYHTLRLPQAELVKKKLLTIWCVLGTVQTLDELLRLMVHSSLETFEDFGIELPAIVDAGRRSLKSNTFFELQNEIRRFFKTLKRNGWRVAIILDEFDAARQVFQGVSQGFQELRSLADNPDWRVAFITCSRRSIPEIESQSGSDISNFHNIFHYLYLKPLSTNEMMKLLQRLTSIDIHLTNEDLAEIHQATGGHPFLTSALGFQLAQLWTEKGGISLDDAQQRAQPIFVDYYDDLSRLLQRDDTFEKLLQILFGPLITATSVDAEYFVRYGLINRESDGTYQPFSRHFAEYLRITERSYELWPLWNKTERCLRTTITKVMAEVYKTDEWVEALERARPKLKNMIDECRTRQLDEQRKFGIRASTNILDYTYPGDLYQIIRAHWSTFQTLFTNNEQYWEQRFGLLARIRNPVAHNRDEVLALHERQIAEGYCREILHRLN